MGALKVWDGSGWRVVGGSPPPVPRIRRYRNSDYSSIASGGSAWVTFPFGTEEENTDPATFSYDGPNDRLTILRAGVYQFSICVSWEANVSGIRKTILTKNDGGSAPSTGGAIDSFCIEGDNRMAASSFGTLNKVNCSLRVAANDSFRVLVSHNAGVNLMLMARSMGGTDWTVVRLGD